MSTVNTPGILSWLPANPDPKPNPNKIKESFYLCELQWNGWHCEPTNDSFVLPKTTTAAFCTKLIPVPKYVPSILEKSYVSYNVTQQRVYFNNYLK
jgi:hypothetical protein